SDRSECSAPAMQRVGLLPDERQTVEDPGGRREAGIRIRVLAFGSGEDGPSPFSMGAESAPVLAGCGDLAAARDLLVRRLEPTDVCVQQGQLRAQHHLSPTDRLAGGKFLHEALQDRAGSRVLAESAQDARETAAYDGLMAEMDDLGRLERRFQQIALTFPV